MFFRRPRWSGVPVGFLLAFSAPWACSPAPGIKVDSPPGLNSASAAGAVSVGTPGVVAKPDGGDFVMAAAPARAKAVASDSHTDGAPPAPNQANAKAPTAHISEGQMVHVPGGTVMVGPPGSRVPVAVPPFDIDVTEVTVAAYAKCLKAKQCDDMLEDDPDSKPGEPPPPNSDARAECTEGHPELSQHPINCISGRQAAKYCAWVKKRLPTDAEWFAAMGTDGRSLPWGATDATKKPCWRQQSTCPVATHPDDMSPFGVFDMAGNVDEWGIDYQAAAATSHVSSPDDSAFVTLGADWKDVSAKTTVRESSATATLQLDTLGFRCAR
jgi:formylglycine-generating enzyme required for sulfatase activity